MKNPIKDISVYSVSIDGYKDRNDLPIKDVLIIVSYGKSGTTRAWYGYTDIVIGKAGGWGYDKEASVLSDAIGYLTDYKKRVDLSSVDWKYKKHIEGVVISKIV